MEEAALRRHVVERAVVETEVRVGRATLETQAQARPPRIAIPRERRTPKRSDAAELAPALAPAAELRRQQGAAEVVVAPRRRFHRARVGARDRLDRRSRAAVEDARR